MTCDGVRPRHHNSPRSIDTPGPATLRVSVAVWKLAVLDEKSGAYRHWAKASYTRMEMQAIDRVPSEYVKAPQIPEPFLIHLPIGHVSL